MTVHGNKKPPGRAAFCFEVCQAALFMLRFDTRRFWRFKVGIGAFPFDGLVRLLSHISLYFAFVLLISCCYYGNSVRPDSTSILLLTAAPDVRGRLPNDGKRRKNNWPLWRIHLRNQPAVRDQSEIVSIFRSAPTLICVESCPFLHESGYHDGARGG